MTWLKILLMVFSASYLIFGCIYQIVCCYEIHTNPQCCLRISLKKFKRLYAIAPHKYKDRDSDITDPGIEYIWNIGDEYNIRRSYLYFRFMPEWLYVKWLLHKPDRIERRRDHIRAQSDFISHVREDLDSYKAKYEKAGSGNEQN